MHEQYESLQTFRETRIDYFGRTFSGVNINFSQET